MYQVHLTRTMRGEESGSIISQLVKGGLIELGWKQGGLMRYRRLVVGLHST